MTNLFIKILSMSLTASYCILFVCVVRLLLKKAPKIFSYLLWSIVAFRLICPFSFESMFSLVGTHFVPGSIYISEESSIDIGTEYVNIEQVNISDKADIYENYIEALGEKQSNVSIETQPNNIVQNNVINGQNPGLQETNQQTTEIHSVDLKTLILKVSTCIWMLVACILAGYGLFTFIRLRQKLRIYAHKTSLYHSVAVWQVTGLDTPFVLGFLHPAIYLPENMTEEDCTQCLAHEYTHIRRKDYLIKQLAFLLVCIYWFNPLVWLAFYLMTKDMEMSCDEVAIRSTSLEDRKAYSGTLLELSSTTKYFSGCPLAFGANSTKARIKNIMNYKRPSFWVMLLAVLLVVVCVVGLTTNPQSQEANTVGTNVADTNVTDTQKVSGKQAPDENIPLDNGNTTQNPEDVIEVVTSKGQTIADYYDCMLEYRKQYQNMLTAYRENCTLKEDLSKKLEAVGNAASTDKAELKQQMAECEEKMNVQQNFLTKMEAIIEIANPTLSALQLTPTYSRIQGPQYRLFAQIKKPEADSLKIDELTDYTTIPVCDNYTDIEDVYSNKSMPENVYSSLVVNELQEGDFVEVIHYGAVEGISDELTRQYALVCWEPWNRTANNCGYVKIDSLYLDVPENTPSTYLLTIGDYFTTYTNLLPIYHVQVKDPNNVMITYYEQTSDNSIINHKLELTLHLAVEALETIHTMSDLYENFVLESVMTSYESISTFREFQQIYGTEAPFSIFDFEGSGFTLLLKDQEELAAKYADPITALENYLHLEGGNGSVTKGKEQGSVYVAYTFTDNYTVNIPMYQLSTESNTNPLYADNLSTFWCIDWGKLNEYNNWKTYPTINYNFSDAAKQQLLDRYTTYLNDRENNNLFVTRIYHGTKIDLDMLLYDGGAMLDNAPFAEGELEMLARENYNEQDIMYHYTTEQIDILLRSKMNISLADVCYKDGEENTLLSDNGWLYLEAYDTYTMPAKGDTLLHDIICTDVKQIYNGGILVSYKSAHKQPWIKEGLLYMRPRTNDSHIKSPEEFYFYANRFLEGGYQDDVIFSE